MDSGVYVGRMDEWSIGRINWIGECRSDEWIVMYR